MRLYADADVPSAVVAALRAEHDVLYVQETGHHERTDAWHLRQASIEQRVTLTLNHKDFRFLHRVWTSMRLFGPVHTRHAGILTATRAPMPPDSWAQPLLVQLRGTGELSGRLMVWHADTKTWREDDWRPDD